MIIFSLKYGLTDHVRPLHGTASPNNQKFEKHCCRYHSLPVRSYKQMLFGKDNPLYHSHMIHLVHLCIQTQLHQSGHSVILLLWKMYVFYNGCCESSLCTHCSLINTTCDDSTSIKAAIPSGLYYT